MIKPKEFLKPKQLLDEAWNENLKYHISLLEMSNARRDYIRNQLIHYLEKKKPTKLDIDLAQIYMNVYDKTQKFTKKSFS